MDKIPSSKSILKRAKSLLFSDKISDLELIKLSVLMNEYIDFMDEFKAHKHEEEYIEKKEKLKTILNDYCDNIEASYIRVQDKQQIQFLSK